MPSAIPLDFFNSQIFGTKIPGPFSPKGRYAPLTDEDREIITRFHQLYYRLWMEGRETISAGWLGYQNWKCPLDLWVYQEIIVETKPDIIVECGTSWGGSSLFLASICQLTGVGNVISVDVTLTGDLPTHALLRYISGSSTDPKVIAQVKAAIPTGARVMVILDSDHARDHVAAELEGYAGLVTPGCYLIVEDGNVNGHPVMPEHGPGPTEALRAFMDTDPPFEVDAGRERFLMSLNPSGYLRRL